MMPMYSIIKLQLEKYLHPQKRWPAVILTTIAAAATVRKRRVSFNQCVLYRAFVHVFGNTILETSGKKPKGKLDKSQIGLPSEFR
jgi:hypothetical protein